MSEWHSLARGVGRVKRFYSEEALTTPGLGFDQLHFLMQDTNSEGLQYELGAIPGETATVHIYEEPGFFGQSRPNLIGALVPSGTIPDIVNATSLSTANSVFRMWLYRNAERTDGVWLEYECTPLPPWSYTAGQQSTYLEPMPCSRVWRPNLTFYGLNGWQASSCVIRFGTTAAGQLAEYSLDCLRGYQAASFSSEPHFVLEMCVLQSPAHQTAKIVVGDFSDLAWHYEFDSGMSFIPSGQHSPITHAAASVSAAQQVEPLPLSPGYVRYNYPNRILCNRIWRASCGRSDLYRHSGHYPTSGIKFGKKPFSAPTTKPTGLALANATECYAYGTEQYETQRLQFTRGLFSVPAGQPSGHWKVMPAANAGTGALSITIGYDSQYANSFPNYTLIPHIGSAIGYTLQCGTTDHQGKALVHNTAYGYASGIARDAPFSRNAWFNGLPQSTGNGSIYLLYTEAPYAPSDFVGVYPQQLFCNASATYANWLSSLELLAPTFQVVPNPGGVPQSPSMNYRTALEEFCTLHSAQAFANLHYGNGSVAHPAVLESVGATSWLVERTPAFYDVPASGIPDDTVSTSGNLDAWQKGRGATVSVSKNRLVVDLFMRLTGIRKWRNVTVWAPRWKVDSATTLVLDGWTNVPYPLSQPIEVENTSGNFRVLHQLSAAETAAFRQTGAALIPALGVRGMTDDHFVSTETGALGVPYATGPTPLYATIQIS